ncbi:nitroreductase [Chloroflexota bacterium]
MELLEGIDTRRSSRAFTITPVPKVVIKDILQAASKSPSYTNTQPWEVAVVCGQKKDELSKIIFELASEKAATSSDIPMPQGWPLEIGQRQREHGARRLEAIGIAREDKEGRENLRLMNFKFYGAPCVIFFFMDRTLGDWSIFDMGLFVQNFILAAHSFGIGSCLQASIMNYSDAIRSFLGIPSTKKLVIGISIGYPDVEARVNTYRALKLKPEEFTRWYE